MSHDDGEEEFRRRLKDIPNIPYTAPLTEQRVREIVREEILAYCLYNIIDKPTNWWSE